VLNGIVLPARLPGRRALLVLGHNVFEMLLVRAFRNSLRNWGTTAPALGSMTLLLLVAGVISLAGVALENLALFEAREASVLHVYLRDDATDAQVGELSERLASDPRVRSVVQVSKAGALERAKLHPGLVELAQETGQNPFPRSLELQVTSIAAMQPIVSAVSHEPAVDAGYPTSYDPETYRRLRQFMIGAGIAAAALLALLTFVGIAVTANSIRAAILARRHEIVVMRLVGAPAWMVRGPFLLEGAMTGAVAGSIAGLATFGISVAGSKAGQGAFMQILPGVTAGTGAELALLVVLTGTVLGAAASLVGVRGLRS
jgi:cell division transport system permease protein